MSFYGETISHIMKGRFSWKAVFEHEPQPLSLKQKENRTKITSWLFNARLLTAYPQQGWPWQIKLSLSEPNTTGLSITDVQSSINNLNPRVAKWPNHPQTYKADPKSETCKLLYLYNYFILYTRNYIFGLPRGRRLYGIPTPTNKFSVPFLLSHCDV